MTEAEAHETVREALSDGLNNSDFYVSLKVTVGDPDASAGELDLDDLVGRANQWLNGLELGPITVSLSALAWKPEVRPHTRPGAVGPHFPVITQ